MQKRNNPFEKKINKEIEEEVNTVENEYIQPKFVQQPVQKQQYQQPIQKNIYIQQQVEPARDKFTSTMERELRRAIKIVCAQRGIMFAQFVEDACREKLAKEVK